MYRKAYLLMTQIENGEIDVERTHTLLESLLEQSEAVGRYDPVKIAKMALERLPGLKEGRRMAIASLVELLAFAFAEPTIETIEKALVKDYSKIEKLRDKGVVTEHFTNTGNVFVLFKEERRTSEGKKALVYMAACLKPDGKVGIIPLKPESTLEEAMAAIDLLLSAKEK